MEKLKQHPFVKKVGFNRIVLVGVLLLIYGAFCLMTGGAFFGMTRILNTMNYVYFLGFLSLGVTFVIATGGIDFSRPILLGFTGLSDALLLKYIEDSKYIWEKGLEKVRYTTIGSVIGTHVGPGAIAVAFYKK